jgi:signal transduction histidine kinase
VPTGQGLVRFRGVDKANDLATAMPSAVYTEKDGLPHSEIYRIFEDSRGDIWVSAYGLARYDRATRRFQNLGGDGPSAFGEDGDGNLWAGYWGGGISRYRDGRFERFNAQDGIPEGLIGWIMRDSRNRLWIGSTEGGVARVDDPTAVKPTFVRYTMAQGLSSSQVNCVTEDRWGRIYLGTGRGLDVLEPDTGRIHHFTTADGLAGSGVLLSARDQSGGLWFATQSGVSRLVPRAPEPRKPPAVFISELSIAGVRRPINLLGEAALEGLVLSPDQRQIEIGFVGLDFSAGERLRYQYRLEGAGTDWSPPADRRSINYAHLSPGRYRFAVRALDSNGQGSLVPSSISFSIMKPVWQRGWFLAISVAALIALSYAFYQYRLKQALRLERIRTHIATDLHDDIGASLSQIAILNEVALQRLQSGAGVPGGMLAAAAQSAREVVDAMSDVVWAVDPKKDRVEDLVLRMRRFAEELCAARGIELRFDATPDGARRLDAQSRRQIYLLFKESLNNAVKHSGCAVIDAKLRIEASRLELDVADDGGGFDPLAGHEGQGLSSMRRRAEALGGEMSIRSGRAQGTQVHFSIPA